MKNPVSNLLQYRITPSSKAILFDNNNYWPTSNFYYNDQRGSYSFDSNVYRLRAIY